MPDTVKPFIRFKIQCKAWTAGTSFGWHKSVVCKSLPRWAFQGSRLLTNYGHVQIWFHPRLTGVIWVLLSHLLPTGSSSRWFVWGLVRTRWLSRNGVGALNLEPTHRCPDEIGDSKMSPGLRPNWLSHHLQLVSGTKKMSGVWVEAVQPKGIPGAVFPSSVSLSVQRVVAKTSSPPPP